MTAVMVLLMLITMLVMMLIMMMMMVTIMMVVAGSFSAGSFCTEGITCMFNRYPKTVHKKDADHALQHRPQSMYVCWLDARDSPLMTVTTESHNDAPDGGSKSADMVAGRPLP